MMPAELLITPVPIEVAAEPSTIPDWVEVALPTMWPELVTVQLLLVGPLPMMAPALDPVPWTVPVEVMLNGLVELLNVKLVIVPDTDVPAIKSPTPTSRLPRSFRIGSLNHKVLSGNTEFVLNFGFSA